MKRRKLRIDGPFTAATKVAESVDKVWHDCIDLQTYLVDATMEEFPMGDRENVQDAIHEVTMDLYYARKKIIKLQGLVAGY